MTVTADKRLQVGVAFALVSAATFGSSGPMAKSLIESGWTAGAAVLVRLGGAAVLLSLAAVVTLRGRWRLRASAARQLVLYGLVAMAGTQLAFFNAVRTLDVGVALLLEYLAPVLLLGWTSLRTRTRPRTTTLVGAAATLVGLVLVLDLTGTSSLDPVGVAWGLIAALCLGGYFVISERQSSDLPPLVMAAGGTAVGTIVIALAGVVGLVPLEFTGSQSTLAGSAVHWALPAAWLIVVATVVAYLSGIAGIVRLRSRLASFVALVEVLFAVLIAWLLLSELPGPTQLAGGAAIIAGIIVIQRSERVAGARPREGRRVAPAHDRLGQPAYGRSHRP